MVPTFKQLFQVTFEWHSHTFSFSLYDCTTVCWAWLNYVILLSLCDTNYNLSGYTNSFHSMKIFLQQYHGFPFHRFTQKFMSYFWNKTMLKVMHWHLISQKPYQRLWNIKFKSITMEMSSFAPEINNQSKSSKLF